MPEIKSFAAPSKYFQGKDLLLHMADYIGFLGDKFLVVTDSIVYGLTKEKLAQGFHTAEKEYAYEVELFGGESTAAEGERIGKMAQDKNCKAIVGLGGGKVIDTSKYAANEAGLPVVIIPTAAASDAPCSAMSVVYDEHGAFLFSKKMKHNPDVVLVDTQVIAEAPVRLLLAGIGDAFATFYEARSAKASGVDNLSLIHILGAGKTEGSMDAGNLLKPMLARGELHCIGATTLDEYRMYIEKDPALERRFQTVMVNEPTVEDTIAILRGLEERYEVFHGVKITDPAIIAAVTLSHRYITDRFLPDKAIDLIDEACAMIRTEMDSMPMELDKVRRSIIQMEIEEQALKHLSLIHIWKGSYHPIGAFPG